MYTSETHKHTHFDSEGSKASNLQGKMGRVDWSGRERELGVSLDEQRQHHKKQNKGSELEEMV